MATLIVKSPTTAAPAAKLAKAKGRTMASHPPVATMVVQAIKALNDRNGSSLQAIKKHMATTHLVNNERLAPHLKKYLKKAVEDKVLIQTKGTGAAGSFKLSANTKAGATGKKTKVVKAKKPAATKKATTGTAKPKTVRKPAKKTTPVSKPKKPAAKKVTPAPPASAKPATTVSAPAKAAKPAPGKVTKPKAAKVKIPRNFGKAASPKKAAPSPKKKAAPKKKVAAPKKA